jgi:DNA-binding HxlR family transcriptional regulator
MSPAKRVCPVLHHAIELIGSRWTGAVIAVLIRDGARFAELRAAIPEISDRMLADRLRALEAEGIVLRTVVPETPVRVEYALTAKGRGLARALDAIGKWAHRWSDDGRKGTTATARASR